MVVLANVEFIHSNSIDKIYKLCMLLHLPQYIARAAAFVYQEFERMNGAGNKSTICLVVAAIYLVCMRLSLPCTIEEIVSKIAIQRGNNRHVYLILAYDYCKVILIQNIIANLLPAHDDYDCHFYFCSYDDLYHPHKHWQHVLLEHIEKNLLTLSREGLHNEQL